MALLDAFDAPGKLEIRNPPPLQLQVLPGLATYEDIANHPLFNPDRLADPVAKAVAVADAGSATPKDLSQFRLVGLVSDGVTRLALVRKADGGVLTLKPGDNLDGWSVLRINSKGVAITGGGREENLAIPYALNRAKTP
jgi:hypothetical protein